MRRFTTIIILFLMLAAGAVAQNLNNTYWKSTLSDNTTLLLKLNLAGNHFSLYSREHGSRDILGNRYLKARLAGKVCRHAVEISGSCRMVNDTLFLTGQYQSLSSKQEFTGTIVAGKLDAKLTRNTLQGLMTLESAPLKDYHAIAQSVIDTTEKYLFNPNILSDKAWLKFKKRILTVSRQTVDSYEFEKLFNINAGQLPFTHYSISPNRVPVATTVKAQTVNAAAAVRKFEIRNISPETVHLVVRTFTASAEEIKPYIDSLKVRNIKNLIVDLRDNPGGTIASALPLARYLVNDTLKGGLFLTQKYFLKHSGIPATTDYQKFPIFSEASFSLIISGIHKQDGLCLMVYPDTQTYRGRLYILTNGSTGSTCEPLVYGLKVSGRAAVVGERTYGGMLNGESFRVGNDYKIWMPTADYYAADGFKIDKNGVKPTIEVKSNEALSKTLELIARQDKQ